MTLSNQPSHPSTGHYVVVLHADAQPHPGPLSGRIEHIASGDGTGFSSGEELLAWLDRHAARLAAPRGTTQAPNPNPSQEQTP